MTKRIGTYQTESYNVAPTKLRRAAIEDLSILPTIPAPRPSPPTPMSQQK